MNKEISQKQDKKALEAIKPKGIPVAQEPSDQKLDKPIDKKEETKKPTEDKPQVMSEAVGINLIPTLSKEEAFVEEGKKKINLGSILSLLALVVISLAIVAFNIITKTRLNGAKEDLYAYENQVMGVSQKIINNNEILERISLYEDIQLGAFSPKEVIEYINEIADKSGGNTQIGDFTFGDDLTFSFSGSANDLEEVSKLWYLLTHDPKVETVNLESVGKGSSNVRFDFEGKLVFEDFTNMSTEE